MSDHLPKRKRLRLAGYDYTLPRAYFVTICLQDQNIFLGEIREAELSLNPFGLIAQKSWLNLPKRYAHIQLDEFIIMPDHVHGILILEPEIPELPADHVPGKTSLPEGFTHCPISLSEVVRAFKTESAKEINKSRRANGVIWQRGFYDRIIRDEKELGHVRAYILNNPAQKQEDQEDLEEWLRLQKSGRVARSFEDSGHA